LSDLVGAVSEVACDRVALTDGHRSWSYAELSDRADAMARRLVALGVRSGDVVAARVRPSMEGVLLVHGVRRAGAVLAPLHPRWTEAEVEAVREALDPVCVLTESVAPESAGVAALHVHVASSGGGARYRGALEGVEPGKGSTAPELPTVQAVLWTSGTEGRRRGVEITADALRHNAAASAERLGLAAQDRWHASLQLAHVGGLALVVRAAALGSAVVATGGFEARELDRLIDAGDVTHASLVPVMLRQILELRAGRRAPRSLKVLLLGGARTPPELVEEALAHGLPVALTYGLTEASSQVATAPPDEVRSDPRSVGRPLTGVELGIAATGEILVRGPTLASGYRGDSGPLTDPDGWLHTGDLGTLDRAGRLRVTGRISARIVTAGVSVDPDEVAGVLRSAPGVADCAVVGIPDARWGEVVVAAVVPTAGSPVDLDALAAHQAPLLASSHRARRFRVVEALPRNPNGKVDAAGVRALFTEDPPP
jgi:O-succinylbenzoic acid--CoA ligase